MDNERIQQLLTEIAQEEIPENMDMWKTIQAQLEAAPPRQLKPVYRPLKVAVIVLVLLMMSAIIYAQLQEPMLDPGLEGANEAGLIQPINASQTIDGVTVTLDWAYADVHRLAVSYTVTGLDISSTDPTEAYYPEVRLADQGANVFGINGWSSMPPGEDQGWQSISTFYTQVYREETGEIDNNYFIHEYGSVPASLDLILVIILSKGLPGMAGPGLPPGSIGPFTFTFTLPLSAAIEVEPRQSVEVNGISATLEYLALTPSQTEARLCYDLPDAQDWQPDASVTIGEFTVPASAWGMTERPTGAETRRCFDLAFNLFYDGAPTTVTLTLNRIQTSEPSETTAFWEQVEAGMAAQGIDMDYEINYGVRPIIVSRPAGMSDAEVFAIEQQVRSDLRPSVNGPWVFRVVVGE